MGPNNLRAEAQDVNTNSPELLVTEVKKSSRYSELQTLERQLAQASAELEKVAPTTVSSVVETSAIPPKPNKEGVSHSYSGQITVSWQGHSGVYQTYEEQDWRWRHDKSTGSGSERTRYEHHHRLIEGEDVIALQAELKQTAEQQKLGSPYQTAVENYQKAKSGMESLAGELVKEAVGSNANFQNLPNQREIIAQAKSLLISSSEKTGRINIYELWERHPQKPEPKLLRIGVDEEIPTIESLGAQPIPYEPNGRQETLLAYPAITVRRTPSADDKSVELEFYLDYFPSREAAEIFGKFAEREKGKWGEENLRQPARTEIQTTLRQIDQLLGLNQTAEEILQSSPPEQGVDLRKKLLNHIANRLRLTYKGTDSEAIQTALNEAGSMLAEPAPAEQGARDEYNTKLAGIREATIRMLGSLDSRVETLPFVDRYNSLKPEVNKKIDSLVAIRKRPPAAVSEDVAESVSHFVQLFQETEAFFEKPLEGEPIDVAKPGGKAYVESLIELWQKFLEKTQSQNETNGLNDELVTLRDEMAVELTFLPYREKYKEIKAAADNRLNQLWGTGEEETKLREVLREGYLDFYNQFENLFEHTEAIKYDRRSSFSQEKQFYAQDARYWLWFWGTFLNITQETDDGLTERLKQLLEDTKPKS